MSLLSAYQDLITSEHKGKPKYMATVTALLQPSNDIFELGVYIDDYFDLDEATGAQENVLGQIAGVGRTLPYMPLFNAPPTLNNDDYRVILKSKIAKNLWKGGIEDLEEIWLNLFGERIKIIDHQDMTIEVVVNNGFSPIIQEAIWRGIVVPKPQSVRMSYAFNHGIEASVRVCAPVTVGKAYEINQQVPHTLIRAPVRTLAFNEVIKKVSINQEGEENE